MHPEASSTFVEREEEEEDSGGVTSKISKEKPGTIYQAFESEGA